ncbi:hypothetical protein AB0L42_45435, partial [Streptomyces sp. NPDC052287]
MEDEATIKVLRREAGRVWLMPRNPAYAASLGVPADAVPVKLTLVQLNAGVEEPSHCN